MRTEELKLCVGCGEPANLYLAECNWCKRNRDSLERKRTWGGYAHDLKLADGSRQYGFIQLRPARRNRLCRKLPDRCLPSS